MADKSTIINNFFTLQFYKKKNHWKLATEKEAAEKEAAEKVVVANHAAETGLEINESSGERENALNDDTQKEEPCADSTGAGVVAEPRHCWPQQRVMLPPFPQSFTMRLPAPLVHSMRVPYMSEQIFNEIQYAKFAHGASLRRHSSEYDLTRIAWEDYVNY